MLTNTIATWLSRIGQNEAWLHPRLNQLSDHTLILERDVFIKRIAQEIKSGGKITVAADYDCDGACSSAILIDCIRTCGGRAELVMASRFLGGYGLGPELTEKILATSPKLVICCDFGSSNHEQIRLIQSHGIDCLILDHHLVPSEKLPAYGFINPHRPECPSSEAAKNLCSGGLALSVAGGLLKELGLNKQIDSKQWLDLAGLATVCDVMELFGDNRIITRYALDALTKANRPGIRALLELSKFDFNNDKADGRTIGFRIGPAINSVGRLQDPDMIVDLLLEKDINRAREIAAEVKLLWDKRRLITEEMTEEAIHQCLLNGYDKNFAIVSSSEQWGHGIVGIVAARLVDKFKVPICVLGHEGRGSLRGPPGSRLYDALVYSKNYLLKWGGHQAACGAQCAPESVEAFRKSFNEFFQSNPPIAPPETVDTILDLDLSDDLMQVTSDMGLLEPTGQGNPKPLIHTSGIIKNLKFVKGDHLKFDLLLDNEKILPCFKIVHDENKSLANGQRLTVQGDLRKNTWMNKTKAEMFVSAIKI